MTDADDAIARLFREGPTADRDEAFAAAVMADVARLRRRANLLLGARLAGGVLLLGGLAVVAQRTDLALPVRSLLEAGPEIVSVPAPFVALGVLAMVLVAVARRMRLVGG